ncbi:MAG: delta-60 repeat domain-containing protein [Polyangiaceae bacterium]
MSDVSDDAMFDGTFGTSGIALTGPSGTAAVNAVAVLPDHRIVAAGYTSPGADTEITVWRLTANGALDSTFGTGGVSVLSFTQLGMASGSPSRNGRATGVALQADGRIVVTTLSRAWARAT